MRNKLILLALTTLLSLIVGVTICVYQIITWDPHSGDSFIHLGFPYKFYYYRPDFELHGSNMKNFIWDGLIIFTLSMTIILMIQFIRKKFTKVAVYNEVID